MPHFQSDTMDTMTFEGALTGHQIVAGVHASSGSANNFHFAAPPSPIVPPTKPFSTIPFPPDLYFIERPVISKWVENTLAGTNRCAALSGLGGVG